MCEWNLAHEYSCWLNRIYSLCLYNRNKSELNKNTINTEAKKTAYINDNDHLLGYK